MSCNNKLRRTLHGLFHNFCNLESLEENEKEALNGLKTDYKRFEFNVKYFFDGITRANKFIDSVDPDVILLTNSLGHQPLIVAAKGRNIPVIEVQHGEISRYHPGFSWPSWARHLKPTLPVPDYLLTYGKYWSEQIILNGFWNEKEVIPIGNCKLDMFLKQKGNAVAAHHTHGEFKRPLKCVYTSQKTTLYEAIPFLLKVLRMAECISCNVFLYIRIHPLEDQKSLDMYKSLERNFPKHCALTTEKDYPLYELLWDADIHCSVYSTCIYESLALGTPTAILGLTGYDYVERLIDTGVARFCKTPEDLLSLITEAEIGGSSWQSYVKETKEARKIVSTDATSEKFVDFLNKISKNTDFQAKKKI